MVFLINTTDDKLIPKVEGGGANTNTKFREINQNARRSCWKTSPIPLTSGQELRLSQRMDLKNQEEYNNDAKSCTVPALYL